MIMSGGEHILRFTRVAACISATAFEIAQVEPMFPSTSHAPPITNSLSPHQKRTTNQLLPGFARFIDIQQRKRSRSRAGVLRVKRSWSVRAQLLQRRSCSLAMRALDRQQALNQGSSQFVQHLHSR
jgi:hypothetical protein